MKRGICRIAVLY